MNKTFVELDDFMLHLLEEILELEIFFQVNCGVPASDDGADLITSALVLYHKFLMNDAKKYGYEPVKEDK